MTKTSNIDGGNSDLVLFHSNLVSFRNVSSKTGKMRGWVKNGMYLLSDHVKYMINGGW